MDPAAALLEHFGFETFHKGQRPVIEDVLAGRPTIAVMPTGAGKSLCYQLPALMLDGVTVVVSPLIALMKDQVDALQARGIAAEFVNSSQSPAEQRAILDRLATGGLRLLYVAPERFRHGAFRRALQQVDVALFAVDEAHCISRWGHDFRPDYTRLDEVITALRPARLLACTATATPDVRDDIVRALGVEAPAVHVAGFLRPNLFLEARQCRTERDRADRLLAFMRRPELATGAIIIYASTRKRAERYVEVAREAVGRRQVVLYHGGMDDADRAEAQDRFMSGGARVAVATNAFGMGVDRADVRAVVHVDLPRTIEGYYQEVGRAGRDRQPAHCLLLFSTNDTRVHEFLIDQSNPPPAAIAGVWAALRANPGAHPAQLADWAQLEGAPLAEAALRQLSKVNATYFDPQLGLCADPAAPADPDALGIDFEFLRQHREHEREKLRQLKRLVLGRGCRHAGVLDYFGEAYEGECPGCDRCAAGVAGMAGIEDGAPTEEEALVIRKALAGVARAGGRYGLKKVAGMLAGSNAKEIRSSPLAELSTYGLLRTLGVDRCAELLQLLHDRDLCETQGRDYPLLAISEAGWAVMQQTAEADFRLPPHLNPESPVAKRVAMLKGPSLDEADLDEDLVEALRAFRTQLAREQAVPPYVIYSDKVLAAIAVARPTDEGSFLAVSGLGPSKWEKFGEALIEVLEAHA